MEKVKKMISENCVQSWYASKIIRELMARPEETYRNLDQDKPKFNKIVRDFVKEKSKKKFIYPEINIISTREGNTEYYLIDLPVVDPSVDNRIIIIASFKVKEKLFSKKIIYCSVYKMVQQFPNKGLFQTNSYISLYPHVLFNSRMIGFLRFTDLHTLINDFRKLEHDELYTKNWAWIADLEADEENKEEYWDRLISIRLKYADFVNEKLFNFSFR